MTLNFSPHSIDQALDRNMLVELRSGVKLINSTIDSSPAGEVNYIVEVKPEVLRRQGTSGDLVIIGVERNTVKSVFLQHKDQVAFREANGRVYRSLVDWEV